MLLTFEYDTVYPGPAFPMAEVTIRALNGESNGVTALALIDSGADATMISLSLLQEIGARRVDRMRMIGAGGSRQTVDIYEVGVEIGSLSVPKVYVVADTLNQGMLLGRDVLNQFIVTLNGLANIVEISQ